MEKENCIFCKIVRGEIPAEIVHSDDISLSFLDINPVNEGHLLIIPKEHHKSMQETPDNLMKELFLKTKELMTGVKEGVGAEYVAISVVGTDVPHFHIHIIPRSKGDGLAGFWPTKKYESPEKMKAVAQKIRESISI
jgi:histidine triad (HIT) family protein